jgi:uncharacterized protein (DUF305 family)
MRLPGRRRGSATLARVCLLAGLSIGGCTAPQNQVADTATGSAHQPMAHAGHGAPSVFQREMTASMARMMEDMHASGPSGDVDIDFLAMMIPHHAGAVDMARLVLQHGRDPATRQLAEEIIAGQTIEIASMTRRLALLRRLPAADRPVEFPSLGGTRGP